MVAVGGALAPASTGFQQMILMHDSPYLLAANPMVIGLAVQHMGQPAAAEPGEFARGGPQLGFELVFVWFFCSGIKS